LAELQLIGRQPQDFDLNMCCVRIIGFLSIIKLFISLLDDLII
jgi:hypothetical protein